MTFIDAGAGTGKTARLVRRVVRAVLSGDCTIEEIAAITFTEKAAAELRDRVRVALVNASEGRPIDRVTDDPLGDLPDGDEAKARAREALRSFHLAPISTLHAFAQRLLVADPVSAGLPDTIEIVDDLAQAERFEQRWTVISNAILADDAFIGEALDRSVALGVDLFRWRAIAAELDGEWDRCREWLKHPAEPSEISPVPIVDVVNDFAAVLEEAEAMTRAGVNDKLAERVIEEIPPRLETLRDVDPADGFAACHVLLSSIIGGRKNGQKKNWADIETAKAMMNAARPVLGHVANEAFQPILRRIAEEAVASAEQRRASGLITFHDVLVLASDLVCGNPSVRLRCRRQYRYLLVDEFQDTDPVQVKIVAALSFAGDTDLALDGEPVALPEEFDLEPGRLVFVGDPKQSIYRFRRADVGVYTKMQERYGDALEVLDGNYRSRKCIVDWTNEVFDKLFTLPGTEGQVGFGLLQPRRDEPSDPLAGPGTFAFGRPVDVTGGEDLKGLEAEAVAAVVSNALGSWEIIDKKTDERRRARASDIAVLLRTRSLLPELSRALSMLGIPFRFEGGGLAWESQEVADVLVVLAALDDPADPSKIVAALRSRALGASDEDLLAWKQSGGRFSLRSNAAAIDPTIPTVPTVQVVIEGLAWMRPLYERRFAMSVAEVVREIIRDCSLEALALNNTRPRDAWARLQLVVDTADQFVASNTTATLRDFLARCAYAADQGTTSNDRVVPEPDDDAVRVLTIHAAKGLEFPVVIVAGLGQATRHGGLQVRWTKDEAGLSVPMMKLSVRHGDDVEDVEVRDVSYRSVAEADSDADALEAERLAYVACTRARDHLAVSLFHREPRKVKDEDTARRQIGPDLYNVVKADNSVGRIEEVPPAIDHTTPRTGSPDPTAAQADRAVPLDREAWAQARRQLLDITSRTAELRTGRPSEGPGEPRGASSEDIELDESAESVPSVPSVRPVTPAERNYDPTLARRVGSAVHQVAELMQPNDPADRLDELAEAAAAEFAVADVEVVRTAVAGLRSSTSWQRASTATRWWRELPMDATIDGIVVAAVADLVWQLPDGTLAVADWKAHSGTADELREQYTGQLDAYGRMLEQGTRLKVSERMIVAVHPRTGNVTEVPLGPSPLRHSSQ